MNGTHTVQDEDGIYSSFFDWLMGHPKYLQIGKIKERVREKIIPPTEEK